MTQIGSRDRRLGLSGAVAIGWLLATAGGALAHNDPSGCSATGVSIEIRVFRANGTTGVVGMVSQCENIQYQAVLTKSSAAACAFQHGTFKLTLPNGMVQTISSDVPCIGGTTSPCDITVQDLTSAKFPYQVALADIDIVTGLITASATYSNGVAHDNEPDTANPPVSGSTPKSTPVILCTDNNLCTSDLCDPNIPDGAACSHIPVVCNDNNACTTEACNTTTGNCDFGAPKECTDNNACTSDTCNTTTGNCEFGPPKTCTDNNECTTDTCNATTGNCEFGPPKTCTDNNACTTDTCNTTTGNCEFGPPKTCTDNNACTTDTCNTTTGNCDFSTPTNCNDNNVCTTDSCNATTGNCDHVDLTPTCDDNNVCTTDVCNPATGCQHTTITCNDNNVCTDDTCVPGTGPGTGCQFTDNSAACDDNNICTDDSCNPQTGCVHQPNNLPQCALLHFQCYEIKPFAFAKIGNVSVVDRFGSRTVTVGTPHPLCAPADKNGETTNAKTDPNHLIGYADPSTPVRVLNQTVSDQFGTLRLDLLRRTVLLVPSSKSHVSPPPPLQNPPLDHFQCYQVRRSVGAPRFVRRSVVAADQFDLSPPQHSMDLLRPRQLCVPANKNNEDPTAPTHVNALLCYKAKQRSRFPEINLFTNNQFGPITPTIIRRLELCVPATVGTF